MAKNSNWLLAALAPAFLLVNSQASAQETLAPPQATEAPVRAVSGIGDMEAHIARLLSRHLARCWLSPTDLPEPQRLRVRIGFALHEDGTLLGEPRVLHPLQYSHDAPMRTAVERGLSAVRECAPYPFKDDDIASQHYELWREIEVTFALTH